MMRWLIYGSILALFLVANSPAQELRGPGWTFPVLDRVPLSIYMPYDVLLGYIALDSVLYWVRERAYERDSTPYWRTNEERIEQVVDFLRRRTRWDDTLRKLVRSLYAMRDYDPILFQRTLYMSPPYKPWYTDFPQPRWLMTWLLDEIQSKGGGLWKAHGTDRLARMRDTLLLTSGYIAHIKVVDTMSVGRSFIITAHILDLIKGQKVPLCDPNYIHGGARWLQTGADFRPWLLFPPRLYPEPREVMYAAADDPPTPPCIQFYGFHKPYFGFRVVDGDLLESWEEYGDTIAPGREYLAFLEVFCFSGHWSGGGYSPRNPFPDSLKCHLVPLDLELPPPPGSPSGYRFFGITIFPIEYRGTEAIVRMPYNDLLLGEEVELTRLKAWLRERIAEYRSW